MDQLAREAGHVGRQIRRHRQHRGWTLDAAADRLGVSRRRLVQLESGAANPTLSTLLSVAAGFDIALTDLLSIAAGPSVTVQERNDAAPRLWSTPGGSEARLLVGSAALELWAWVLAPGETRASEPHRPGTQEALMVTGGAVAITVGASSPVEVRSGQSASFPADEPHSYTNAGSEPARFALAVHEPLPAGPLARR
jgi:transcriptional regulator with XRE-family HTH domain